MSATELTNSGWKKNSVILGSWTNRADIVRDQTDGIVVAPGITANTRDGSDAIFAIRSSTILPGVTYIGFTNRGTVITGEGRDSIRGSANDFGISNTGRIDTGDDNDIINGSAGSAGVGLFNSGRILTGQGNDSIKGTSGGVGLINRGLIDTADGNDTVEASGRAGGLTNNGSISTGSGNDIIRARGFGQGLYNNSSINMGTGDDILEGNAASNAVFNSGRINMGDGNNVVSALKIDPITGKNLSPGEFAGGGTINFGKGNDLIIGFGNQKIVDAGGFDVAVLGVSFDNTISLGMSNSGINITANSVTMSFKGIEQFVFSTGQAFSLQQLQAMI